MALIKITQQFYYTRHLSPDDSDVNISVYIRRSTVTQRVSEDITGRLPNIKPAHHVV